MAEGWAAGNGNNQEPNREDYWGRLCYSMAARCIECSSLGMRGDPMGVLRVSSSSHHFYESDCPSDLTHDSPRPSINNISGRLSDATGLNAAAAAAGPAGTDTAEHQAEVLAQLGRGSMEQPRAECSEVVNRLISRVMKRSKCQQVASDPMLFPRVALMAMLTLLIAILTALAWYAAMSQIHKSVATLSSSLRKEVAVEVGKPLLLAFEYTRASVIALSRLLSVSNISGTTSTAMMNQVTPLLWTAYFMRPGRGVIGFLAPNGAVMAYSGFFSETSFFNSNSSRSGGSSSSGSQSCISPSSFTWYSQQVDPNTGELGRGQEVKSCMIYLTNTSLYEAALSDTSDNIYWEISVDMNGSLSIIGMHAVKGPGSSRPSGVAFVSRSFDDIIRNVDAFRQQFFVMTEDGELLAEFGSTYALQNPQRNLTLPLASESNRTITAQVSVALARKWLRDSSVASSSYAIDNLEIDGEAYHINTVPLNGYGKGLVCIIAGWLHGYGFEILLAFQIAVLVIQAKSLAVGVDKRIHDMGLMFIGLAISTVVLGCCLVVMLTKGVSISMRVEQSYIAQVKATKLAEKRSNHKRLFFANMSHDLRTPLAAIIGLIDLCLSHGEHISVELEANMVQMKTCATTLLGILNSILDMSKAEVGKLELDVSEFDLIKVLEEAVDIFAVVGSKKGIEVVLDLPDDSIENVRWVRGDAGRVKQLLCDLLSNGVKFTSHGYVILRAYPKHASQSWVASASRRSGRWFHKTFRLGAVSCFRPGTTVQNTSQTLARGTSTLTTDTLEFEFEVEDTGQGIPQSRQEAVFRNFVQGSSKVHCTYGGTGLGLAIVRSLVHMMGGQIKVANKEGPGTLFKFNLLFQKPSREVIPTTSSSISRGVSQCWPLNGNHQSFGEESQLLENAAPVGGLEGHNMQVVLATKGDLGRSFISSWMQKKGAQVFEVLQWQNIIPSLDRILTDRTSVCSESSLDIESNGTTGRFRRQTTLCLAMLDTALIPEGNGSIATKFRVDLDELIRKSKGLGKCIHVCWIFSADTSNLVWQTLHSRLDLIIHKPVHGSRLVTLLEDLQAQHFQHFVADQEQAQLVRGASRKSDNEGRRRSSSSQNGFVLDAKVAARGQGEASCTEGTSNSDTAGATKAAEGVSVNYTFSSSDTEQSKSKLAGSLAHLRILVVEDTPLLQKVTKTMLEREGVQVEVASNGEEAVRAISATLTRRSNASDVATPSNAAASEGDMREAAAAFDLVLMDCQMPVMDGYTATIRIREMERGGRIPIIALTAHAMLSDEEKCKEVGMDAYLTKPLKLDALTRAINSLNIRSK